MSIHYYPSHLFKNINVTILSIKSSRLFIAKIKTVYEKWNIILNENSAI